ncbi:MAG: hypothetical protein DDT35_01544 [Firmicutes bacterium]|nr:hypothetical protein [Bacillota bacterium]
MRTLGPAVAEFFAGNLRHTKGSHIGQPFALEPWQQEIINLVYEIDNHGRRKWRSVLLGLPRGNGKSPLAAGIGLFELITRSDAPDGGPLVDFLHFPKSRTSAISCTHNHGRMRVLSADGDLQHGLSVSAAIIDELHAFKTNKQEELFFALLTATQKREDSITLMITTAGASKASLLGEKYEAMIKTHKLEYSGDGCTVVGKNEDAGSLLIWVAAPDSADVSDRAIWRACNPRCQNQFLGGSYSTNGCSARMPRFNPGVGMRVATRTKRGLRPAPMCGRRWTSARRGIQAQL